MRLFKFLIESLNIFSVKLHPTTCPFQDSLCFEYTVEGISFICEIVYKSDVKELHFGFRRAHSRKMYSQEPDFEKYAGKVYAGVLQGLHKGLEKFPNTQIIVGTAFKDPDELKTAPRINPKTGKLRKTISDWYNSKFFKKAVEKAAPNFKFSSYVKQSHDIERWVYIRK